MIPTSYGIPSLNTRVLTIAHVAPEALTRLDQVPPGAHCRCNPPELNGERKNRLFEAVGDNMTWLFSECFRATVSGLAKVIGRPRRTASR